MDLKGLRAAKNSIRATKWNNENKEKRKIIAMNSQWKKNNIIIDEKPFTYDDYNKFLIEQNFCCKICKLHQSELKKTLSVDHCHLTGKVRGLLCQRCNTLLGMSCDNIKVLISAIEYLEQK